MTVPQRLIEYRLSDGREVRVEFIERADRVLVKTAFDETEDSPEIQGAGW